MRARFFELATIGLCAAPLAAAAESPAFPDFATALRAADAASSSADAERLFSSLPTYPMRCQDARQANAWLKDVKLDARDDGQMQLAARRARSVAKALSRAVSADCHAFLAKELRAEGRRRAPDVFARAGSRKALFEATIESERIRALIAAAGDGKNEQALETLRSIQRGGGAFAEATVAALGHIGRSEDLDRFILELKRNPRARLRIAEFGTPAIRRIMREVDDPAVPREQKDALIGAIAHAGGHESLPLYLELLRHSDPFVSRVAAEGLARVAEPADEPTLKELLKDPNHEIRYNALQALNRLWDPSLAGTFIEVLRSDRDGEIRGAAARALGEHRVCSAEDALREAAKDPNRFVRSYAERSLKELRNEQNALPRKPKPKPPVSDELKRTFAASAERIRPNLDALIATASSRWADPVAKASAFADLEQAIHPKAIDALMRIASGKDAEDAQRAISGLGASVRNAAHAPGLSPAQIERTRAFLRAVVAESSPTGPTRARFILAADALNAAGDRAPVFDAAEKLLRAGDNNVFRNIEVDDESLPFILKATRAEHPEHIRFTAVHRLALAGYQEQAEPLLVDLAMNGKDRIIRYDCLRLLWHIGDEKAKEAMNRALAVPELKDSAEHFLNAWIGRCPE